MLSAQTGHYYHFAWTLLCSPPLARYLGDVPPLLHGSSPLQVCLVPMLTAGPESVGKQCSQTNLECKMFNVLAFATCFYSYTAIPTTVQGSSLEVLRVGGGRSEVGRNGGMLSAKMATSDA